MDFEAIRVDGFPIDAELIDTGNVGPDLSAAAHAYLATPRALVNHLFRRNLDGMMSMALAETLAHVNYLVGQGRLQPVGGEGALRLRSL